MKSSDYTGALVSEAVLCTHSDQNNPDLRGVLYREFPSVFNIWLKQDTSHKLLLYMYNQEYTLGTMIMHFHRSDSALYDH